MRHERTSTLSAGHPSKKRCPACQQVKPVSEFYVTVGGRPSGYCKACQRAVSRTSRLRRQAAVRLQQCKAVRLKSLDRLSCPDLDHL
jgi:hypothetical protein